MKKFKPALHWQILVAIVLAVIYGIIFPTKYKITNETYESLSSKAVSAGLDEEQLLEIELLTKKPALSKNSFIEELSKIDKKSSENLQELILAEAKYNPQLNYVSWIGDIFMRALKMIIIPLILTSIISGIANIGSAGNFGRLGLKTMLYYLSTSTFAILSGLFFVNIIKPGIGIDSNLTGNIDNVDLVKTPFSETLINIIPENIFEAFANQQMLSVIFFALLFGFFITRVSNKSRTFMTNFFNSSFEVMMKVTMFIILFTPLGIFGIVAKTIAENTDNLKELFESLGLYSVTVLLGLSFHALVTLPLIVKFVAKSDPWNHFKVMRAALLTAFSTSSSSATLSLTMESVKNGSGVSNKVSGFTLPLGATINMDGTALYECVAALFIAQAYGYDLSVGEQIIVVATALLASIGAASIPMAGLVMLSVVLSAVDLPLVGIVLILPVDRILDMFRTSVNVWSDSCGAVTVAKTEGEKLLIDD